MTYPMEPAAELLLEVSRQQTGGDPGPAVLEETRRGKLYRTEQLGVCSSAYRKQVVAEREAEGWAVFGILEIFSRVTLRMAQKDRCGQGDCAAFAIGYYGKDRATRVAFCHNHGDWARQTYWDGRG